MPSARVQTPRLIGADNGAPGLPLLVLLLVVCAKQTPTARESGQGGVGGWPARGRPGGPIGARWLPPAAIAPPPPPPHHEHGREARTRWGRLGGKTGRRPPRKRRMFYREPGRFCNTRAAYAPFRYVPPFTPTPRGNKDPTARTAAGARATWGRRRGPVPLQTLKWYVYTCIPRRSAPRLCTRDSVVGSGAHGKEHTDSGLCTVYLYVRSTAGPGAAAPVAQGREKKGEHNGAQR